MGNQKIWSHLIQPLGEGTFDNRWLLSRLEKIGFTGPVGLQCYNIPGDKRDILSRSATWWRKYLSGK